MIYVMSDLNGHLEEWKQMLAKIRFTKRDEMYVLGNIIDIGPDPIPLLQEMMMYENVYPLLGYREYRCIKCLSGLPEEATMENLSSYLNEEQMQLFAEWIKDGGNSTITQFFALSAEDREAVMDYLGECMPYEVVESCNQKYLLTNSGIQGYDPEKDLDEYPVKAFISDISPKIVENWDSDQILILGNVPVTKFPYAQEGLLYFGDNYVAINCNISHPEEGGRLGCLRLGDESDFYVD